MIYKILTVKNRQEKRTANCSTQAKFQYRPNQSCIKKYVSNVRISKFFRPAFNKTKNTFCFQNRGINMKNKIKFRAHSKSQISKVKNLLWSIVF